eukprot:7803_1
MSNINSITILCINILWLLSIISIIWLLSFYLLRNQRQILARDPHVSILKGILCVMGIMICYPCVLYFYNINNVPKPSKQICQAITNLLILVTTVGPYHIFTFRAYMVYFNSKWNTALIDTKWRMSIDPNESNWFLNNRNTWGNPKRIGTILFLHVLLWIIILETINIIDHENLSMIRTGLGISALIPTIFDAIIYIKFPKFNDLLSITDEIKLILRFEITLIILFSIFGLVLNAQHYSYKFLILSIIPPIMLFIFILCSFYYPLKQCNLPTTPWNAIKYINISRLDYNYPSIPPVSPTTDEIDNRKFDIRQILQNEIGFNEFARHLTRELCIENLLFLVETSQWLDVLSEQYGFTEDILQLKFTDSAPKSPIVDKYNIGINNLKVVQIGVHDLPCDNEYLQSVLLFEKYISNDAIFCVNISGMCRKKLYKQFGYGDDNKRGNDDMLKVLQQDKITHEQLFNLFDESRQEVLLLLLSAFRRFKRTEQYEKVCNAISDAI